MFVRKVFSLVVLFLCLAAFGESQPRQIKYVPVKPTSPALGQEMYTAYCAVCHGKDGKGNGPAAEALKIPPPDLTILAKKNRSSYPSDRVRSAIAGDVRSPAHGSKEMPVWGELFWRMSQGHSSEVQLRISNLNKHIESMQRNN
ncbi:MAG: c-type cytochrome [Terriglobales bacterium]|jgi:mono/diheme cytochrome c family protein